MAPHSSILAWKIPKEPGYSPWHYKESDMTERTHTHMHLEEMSQVHEE